MQNQPETGEPKRHHFLFYIFRMDKEANPMPSNRAQTLLQCLKRVFAEKSKEKERD